jgi:HAD superfamily hydrolase (TIGR01509 family)
MIRNVVLDIGNVLVTFYPDLYIAQFVHRKGEIDYYNNICFRSTEWKKGDTGEKTRREIIDALCAKYPEDAETIHTVMDDCDEMLRISKKSTEVVKRLHEAGVSVYYLSNTNPEAFRYMTERYEVFRYMDGGIASYQDGVVKPSAEIFRLFLDRYGKDPSECVFVDDMPVNTEAAQGVGLHTITLKNIEDLGKELSKFPELRAILSENG